MDAADGIPDIETTQFEWPDERAAYAKAHLLGRFAGETIGKHYFATHDKLTGLSDQSAYMELLSRTVESLGEGDAVIAYVADVDGFKAVNDELGHPVGDELLRIIGGVFRDTFQRDSDMAARGSRESDEDDIARLGGDEFSSFTVRKSQDNHRRNNTPENEASMQVSRLNSFLKERVAGTKFERFDLKLSVGTAVLEPRETATGLFARADLNMFKMKYTGKIERLTDEDKHQLRKIIPFLESKGARVEAWLKQGAGLLEAA